MQERIVQPGSIHLPRPPQKQDPDWYERVTANGRGKGHLLRSPFRQRERVSDNRRAFVPTSLTDKVVILLEIRLSEKQPETGFGGLAISTSYSKVGIYLGNRFTVIS